jgi:hypothetical protein
MIEMKKSGRWAHLGFRRSPESRSAHWSRSPARFQWLLGDSNTTTGFKRARRTRLREPPLRSRPEETRKGGWRSTERQWASGLDDGVDLRRNRPSQLVREEHPVEVERIEVQGGARAHLRRRIWAGRLLERRRFGDRFWHPRCNSCRETKGEKERSPGAICRRLGMEKGLGFRADLIGRLGRHRALAGLCLELEEGADRWD